MITDDELNELPADHELAFVAIEKILRTRVEERESQARNNDFDPDPDRLEYMIRTLAAARACQIEALIGLAVPRVSRKDLWEDYSQFKNDVDFVTTQIRLNSARFNREGSIGLDNLAKTKIHHFITQIKDEIERSELGVDKKEALLDALNKFAKEVDRLRTRMQVGMALWMTFATGLGSGFEKLKPVREMLDSIARVLGNAKTLEDHYSLPSPNGRKRIEPPPSPPKQLPRSNSTEIDEDIPF